MGDISEHFDRSEFACRCQCGFDTVDTELLKYLEQIREHFDQPIKITSGCRCPEYNGSAMVGGSKNSQHLIGRAADIIVQDVPHHVVQELAHNLGIPGVGSYGTFTHIDTRSTGLARW